MDKRPIIILMLKDDSDVPMHFAVEAFSSEMVKRIVQEHYLVYGLFSNNMDPSF
jgi:hypothetical protein